MLFRGKSQASSFSGVKRSILFLGIMSDSIRHCRVPHRYMWLPSQGLTKADQWQKHSNGNSLTRLIYSIYTPIHTHIYTNKYTHIHRWSAYDTPSSTPAFSRENQTKYWQYQPPTLSPGPASSSSSFFSLDQ